MIATSASAISFTNRHTASAPAAKGAVPLSREGSTQVLFGKLFSSFGARNLFT